MRFANGMGKTIPESRYRVGARSVVVLIAGEGVNGNRVVPPQERIQGAISENGNSLIRG